MVSNRVFAPKDALAEMGQTLNAERLFFVGADGRVGGQVYMGANGAILNLNGKDQVQRLQMGTYDNPGEAGLPMLGLSDNKGNLRMLLRLAGTNESPVLIFKDREHRDRIIIGLGLNDLDEEPCFATFDKNGNKHMLTGSY